MVYFGWRKTRQVKGGSTGSHLGSDDKLIAYTARFLPFSNEFFGRLVLATKLSVRAELGEPGGSDILIIGGINKVPAVIEKGIQKLEARRLVHRTHTSLGPFVANAHSTQGER